MTMTTDTTYNGWTNRATWLVNVWGNPESREDVESLREMLTEQVDALPDGILKDMIDLDEINWDELCSQFDEESDDEESDTE